MRLWERELPGRWGGVGACRGLRLAGRKGGWVGVAECVVEWLWVRENGVDNETRSGVEMYALCWHYGAGFDEDFGSLELNNCEVVWMLDWGRNFYSRCAVAC